MATQQQVIFNSVFATQQQVIFMATQQQVIFISVCYGYSTTNDIY